MQWLIDIIAQSVLNQMTGLILLWFGAIVNIPAGWSLCDGSNGTPDLQDNFVLGAGDTYNPNDSGGDADHGHGFTGNGHWHGLQAGGYLDIGSGFVPVTTTTPITGNTDNQSSPPPYYALAYIQRTG